MSDLSKQATLSITQEINTCSESAIEALEKRIKSKVKDKDIRTKLMKKIIIIFSTNPFMYDYPLQETVFMVTPKMIFHAHIFCF